MEINANYVENISSNISGLLKKLLFRYVENCCIVKDKKSYRYLSKEEIKKFEHSYCQIEDAISDKLTDEIGYSLCTTGKVLASFSLAGKKLNKDNIYPRVFAGFEELNSSRIFEGFMKNYDIKVKGDKDKTIISKVVGNKVEQRKIIVNLEFACEKV